VLLRFVMRCRAGGSPSSLSQEMVRLVCGTRSVHPTDPTASGRDPGENVINEPTPSAALMSVLSWRRKTQHHHQPTCRQSLCRITPSIGTKCRVYPPPLPNERAAGHSIGIRTQGLDKMVKGLMKGFGNYLNILFGLAGLAQYSAPDHPKTGVWLIGAIALFFCTSFCSFLRAPKCDATSFLAIDKVFPMLQQTWWEGGGSGPQVTTLQKRGNPPFS